MIFRSRTDQPHVPYPLRGAWKNLTIAQAIAIQTSERSLSLSAKTIRNLHQVSRQFQRHLHVTIGKLTGADFKRYQELRISAGARAKTIRKFP